MREDLKKPLLEAVRILGIAMAVYLAMRFVLPPVIPFLLAFFLAKQLQPLVEKLHKKSKIKKDILSAVLLLLFLAALLLLLWLAVRKLVPQLKQLFADFPAYQEKILIFWEDGCTRVEKLAGIRAGTLRVKIAQVVPEVWDNLKGTLLPGLIGGSFSWVKGICVAVGICIVVGISTLLIRKEYENILAALGKNVLGQTVLRVAGRVYRAGGGYVKAQLLIMVAVSAVCVAGLFCTGNPYALPAGLGIGLCDALPFLGTGTVFIPWAVIELIQGKYLLAAAYAVIYTVANLTRELLEPKLVGERTGIPPLAVIVSVYLGLYVYGLWGFALGPLSYILIREIRLEMGAKGT